MARDELRGRLQQQYGPQQQHHHETAPRALALARSVVGTTGTGFVYGAMLGGVLAAAHGLRDAPAPLASKLRGALLRVQKEAPRTAGHVALVACAFRLAALALAHARGGVGAETGIEDLWGVLLAAPLAGAALRVRHGPRAALRSALSFGSVAAVMLAVHAAERAVERQWPGAEEGEVEEEELADEAREMLLLLEASRRGERRCQGHYNRNIHRRHKPSRHSGGAYEAREVLEEIAFAEELDE